MPAFLQGEAPSVLRVPGWWGRKEVGEWGRGARHMSENATHLKVMLVQIGFDTVENLYKKEETGVEQRTWTCLLFLCAPHRPFALLPGCAHSAPVWVIQKPKAFHRQCWACCRLDLKTNLCFKRESVTGSEVTGSEPEPETGKKAECGWLHLLSGDWAAWAYSKACFQLAL